MSHSSPAFAGEGDRTKCGGGASCGGRAPPPAFGWSPSPRNRGDELEMLRPPALSSPDFPPRMREVGGFAPYAIDPVAWLAGGDRSHGSGRFQPCQISAIGQLREQRTFRRRGLWSPPWRPEPAASNRGQFRDRTADRRNRGWWEYESRDGRGDGALLERDGKQSGDGAAEGAVLGKSGFTRRREGAKARRGHAMSRR